MNVIEHLFVLHESWKEVMVLFYYAGYRHKNSDIAVFDTEEERDKWIENFGEFSLSGVRKFTDEEVSEIFGDNRPEEYDEFGVKWYVNPIYSCELSDILDDLFD